jgi:hypothetical protein
MIARLGLDDELRWAQEVYTSSGRTSLVQSRCSCYPLFVRFAVVVTNGRERGRGLPSLYVTWACCYRVCEGDRTRDVSLPQTWSQALPFIAQGRGSGLHGGKRRKRRKRIAEQYEGESLHGVTVLLLGVGPASLVIKDGGDPLQRRATATVATVVCHPSWWQ